MNVLTPAWPSLAAKIVFSAALLVATAPSVQAHLMVGQRGTLNIVGSGAFMVISVPVSAFDGVDDDGNGKLSMIEFNDHREDLTAAVVRRARLLDERGPRPLQGIMMAPSIPDDDPLGSATHLVVMGRFALPETTGLLEFDVDLFGTADDEQALSVTVTRKATDQKQAMILTPDQPAHELFPS